MYIIPSCRFTNGYRRRDCENELVYPKLKSRTLLNQGSAFFDLVKSTIVSGVVFVILLVNVTGNIKLFNETFLYFFVALFVFLV